MDDDFPRSVALLRRADVLLVNPIRDGLNLVASEGALVNDRDAVLALSPEAGAWERLHPAALRVPPFDVAGTADVLHAALTMPADERASRATQLRAAGRGPHPRRLAGRPARRRRLIRAASAPQELEDGGRTVEQDVGDGEELGRGLVRSDDRPHCGPPAGGEGVEGARRRGDRPRRRR